MSDRPPRLAPERYDSGPRYTPHELAHRLRLPPPTDEQAAVISAPVAPLLVVAGAGSGKTETMAARVLWLVANEHVRPDQILGLTFTRKAAGELAHRVRVRLGQLRRRMPEPGQHRPAGEPTISTYHSFAARIVSEHGLRAGFEPSARLLSEAACWQLADEVVSAYDGDMSHVDKAKSTVTRAVLELAGQMAEHLVGPDDLSAWTGRFIGAAQGLPGRVYAPVRDLLDNQRARLQLMPIVRAYAARKAVLEAMDFGDQLSRAAQVARDHAEVGEIERQRFGVVLLDEYQDTSHAQVVLLKSLFGGGHPVTAVGDPCQSIYGWRGASAGTLDRFPADFPQSDGRPATGQALSRSFRNRREILHVANAISAPLRERGARVLALRGDGRTGFVHCALTETIEAEAQWIARRIDEIWQDVAGEAERAGTQAAPPTTAVLVRVRSQIEPIEAALRERGIPVEVVGLGGLLDTPEVRDVVCTLRVLADPADGASLLRMLTGARWRIGPRDLVALHRRSRQLAAARRGDPDAIVRDRLDEAALSEALHDLGDPEHYSAPGYARFRAYAAELAEVRRHLDQPLPDLVAEIERVTGLEVEVSVRAQSAAGGDAGLARSHLDAFGDVAARFAAETEGATLSAFLAYLRAAEDEERGLALGEVEVVEGAVQILTAHAAKGLEWDLVAVAGLTQGVWPGKAKNSDHYLDGLGVLPFPLRGDHDGLPAIDLAGSPDQKALRDSVEAFRAEWQAHDEREERRLAYVAVTRPRMWLLASGSWWGTGITHRRPSLFLEEIAAVCRDGDGIVEEWHPEPEAGATNPTLAHIPVAEWPTDPLGRRRPRVREAADLVLDALAAKPSRRRRKASGDDTVERWRREAELLLAERAELARSAAAVEVVMPRHLSVSQLVSLQKNPRELAYTLRRPLPQRPDRVARRGTAFHLWLERRFGASRLLDVDELPGYADGEAAEDTKLAALQAAFLGSEWADRQPAEVEVPFATVLGGVVVRGRMDAVFQDDDGTYDVVDWKTGRRPTGATATAAAVQLAAYRLAWAALAGVPVERVRAAFHYVPEKLTVRPADLLDEAGLTAMIAGLPTASGS
ncbi:ATP-dependent helicase [Hamadaea tsunoensis]|uniref:ATP-dependent helicase n=1 Tax=Hamadaea tsunoensis TaxID=53368 RepID=UPI00041591F7|nr:UvrD-helicase domain-containing protein [Hamadaea tsunoensis]